MEKKNGKGLIILVAIICCVICLVGGYSLGKGIFTNKEETNNNEANKNSDNKVNTEEEVELTDVYIKKDISKKASILLSVGFTDEDKDIITIGYGADQFLNYSDKYKMAIVLHYNYYNTSNFRKMYYSDVNELDEKLKQSLLEYGNGNIDEFLREDYGIRIAEADKIRNSYEDIFGEKTPTITDEVAIVCPWFNYDSKSDTYISNSNCGDAPNTNYIYYKHKYTTKLDNAYVYVNVASMDRDDNVYKGLEQNTNNYLYKIKSTFSLEQEVKTNYEKYAKYRLVFEKDSNGIYHYKSTEKLD
ncbi:MAG: hypothetical protein IJ574_05205 [Bacilli bacterium]|nr:hypothetical protein [Bacilli bacterium]